MCSVPAQPILHRMCTLSKGSILHAVCGGTPLSSETCDPCGRTAQPSDGEGDACRHSPPNKPPSTLRRGCKGTEDNILHVGCGGTPPDHMTCDPCGRTASAGDSCGHSPLEPQIVHLGRHDPVDSPTPVARGLRSSTFPSFTLPALYCLRPRPRSRVSNATFIRIKGELYTTTVCVD